MVARPSRILRGRFHLSTAPASHDSPKQPWGSPHLREIQARELAMVAPGRSVVGASGSLCSREVPKKVHVMLGSDARAPAPIPVGINAFVPAPVRPSPSRIPCILRWRTWAKVAALVVELVSVAMIDMTATHQKAMKTHATSLDSRAWIPCCVEMPEEGCDALCVHHAHARDTSMTKIDAPSRLPLTLESASTSARFLSSAGQVSAIHGFTRAAVASNLPVAGTRVTRANHQVTETAPS